MGHNNKAAAGEFADYLQSIVKLDALEKITQTLDNELLDSEKAMMEIKSIFNTYNREPPKTSVEPNNATENEDAYSFLRAGAPNLLLSDMDENNIDINLDDLIATMKGYAEDLKKNFTAPGLCPQSACSDIKSIDLTEYANSLGQLGQRLANIKCAKKVEIHNRNTDLVNKLEQLCQDVTMFTRLVTAKTTLSQSNKNWEQNRQDSDAIFYHNIINKMLSGINEVTYLLQNNN